MTNRGRPRTRPARLFEAPQLPPEPPARPIVELRRWPVDDYRFTTPPPAPVTREMMMRRR